MARRNGVLVDADIGTYRGKFWEGKIASGITPKPGVIVQIQASSIPAPTSNAKFTFELYNCAADGSRPSGPFIVLLENSLIGKTVDDAYAAGDQCSGYTPLPGDELNLMISDISGTGDDHTKGEVLIVDDGTGELIATASTPETECAMLLETITDPTSDYLAWCVWSGY